MKCTTNRCRTSVFDELGRGLDQLMGTAPGSDVGSSDDPRLSLLAFDNRYVIECDLPGVAIDNVSLQIEDGVLTISGRRTPVTADENVKVVLNERPAAEFTRRIQLAKDVDQSAVDAELTHGVLRVTIPKRAEVLPRKIAIKRQQVTS